MVAYKMHSENKTKKKCLPILVKDPLNYIMNKIYKVFKTNQPYNNNNKNNEKQKQKNNKLTESYLIVFHFNKLDQSNITITNKI